jgi:hypothetical protein
VPPTKVEVAELVESGGCCCHEYAGFSELSVAAIEVRYALA